jgi:hypothetical protein
MATSRLPHAAPRWYTVRQLGERWTVAPETVRRWLFEARLAGDGPRPEQIRHRRGPHAWTGSRRVLLRADYAIALFRRSLKRSLLDGKP